MRLAGPARAASSAMTGPGERPAGRPSVDPKVVSLGSALFHHDKT